MQRKYEVAVTEWGGARCVTELAEIDAAVAKPRLSADRLEGSRMIEAFQHLLDACFKPNTMDDIKWRISVAFVLLPFVVVWRIAYELNRWLRRRREANKSYKA